VGTTSGSDPVYAAVIQPPQNRSLEEPKLSLGGVKCTASRHLRKGKEEKGKVSTCLRHRPERMQSGAVCCRQWRSNVGHASDAPGITPDIASIM